VLTLLSGIACPAPAIFNATIELYLKMNGAPFVGEEHTALRRSKLVQNLELAFSQASFTLYRLCIIILVKCCIVYCSW
jgi:hypothetical protein